jgi:hypothetical protein
MHLRVEVDDVKAAIEGELRTIEERQPLGSATVWILVNKQG